VVAGAGAGAGRILTAPAGVPLERAVPLQRAAASIWAGYPARRAATLDAGVMRRAVRYRGRRARPVPLSGWPSQLEHTSGPGLCKMCWGAGQARLPDKVNRRARRGCSEGFRCVWVKVGAGRRGRSATSIVWRGEFGDRNGHSILCPLLGCESVVTVPGVLRERVAGDPDPVLRARPLSGLASLTLGRSSAASPRPASTGPPTRCCWNPGVRKRSFSCAAARVFPGCFERSTAV